MSPPKAMHGARALVYVDNQLVGSFESVSYSLTYDLQPIYVLGRHSAVETVYTAMETVPVSCGGYRAIGFGPHTRPAVPKLQDLLQHEYFTITIMDRQNPDSVVAKITQVRPSGYNMNIAQRAIANMSINYVGLMVDDESAGDGSNAMAESPTAVQDLGQ